MAAAALARYVRRAATVVELGVDERVARERELGRVRGRRLPLTQRKASSASPGATYQPSAGAPRRASARGGRGRRRGRPLGADARGARAAPLPPRVPTSTSIRVSSGTSASSSSGTPPGRRGQSRARRAAAAARGGRVRPACRLLGRDLLLAREVGRGDRRQRRLLARRPARRRSRRSPPPRAPRRRKTPARSSAVIAAAARSSARSAAARSAASAASGRSSTVTRWPFSTNRRATAAQNTRLPRRPPRAARPRP